MNSACEHVRVRGLVQGVGFRPTVWRIASELGLVGDVHNDGGGVLIRLWGEPASIDLFCANLQDQCPPLARIDSLERTTSHDQTPPGDFRIVASENTRVRTGIVPDAATCPACRAEIFNRMNRRHRYPFTNCTHCGPRLTIVRGIPYDRANTSMAAFPMCPDCRKEYENPADRRFHAQPNACPECGPRAWLEDAQGRRLDPNKLGAEDAVAAASAMLSTGRILAIKGIGGFHLACDAADANAVAELRRRKRRYDKPFALMARDTQTIGSYVRVSDAESDLLASPAAPIVLLERRDDAPELPSQIAPGQTSLGFMLPYSPLHHLLLAQWDRPLVMTSGNLTDEPQCTDNADAGGRLGDIADAFLLHDRPIVNRVDDSVVRMIDGAPRFLRRARGYAPAPLSLPPGFGDAPPTLALGGELKNAICLLKDGQAILSQHLGDLEDARTAEDFEQAIALYLQLFDHAPRVLAVDLHEGYRSTQLGREWAARDGIALEVIQHHHAHVAAVLADNNRASDAGPVLGIALDGLGHGEDGTIWGGEFLVADYSDFRRVGTLMPTPLPGGTKAILQPWRNTWANLFTHVGWQEVLDRWPRLELSRWLRQQPLDTLERMLELGMNSPQSSSCGRLFDAVAGALNIRREGISYEGQAAIELETLACRARDEKAAYPFDIVAKDDLVLLDPRPFWDALLHDLASDTDPARIAMRFHRGLAIKLAEMAMTLAEAEELRTVGLSGGVLQNRTLFETMIDQLHAQGLEVLTHHRVPTNDGGLALGQAAIAAARAR